MTGEIPDNVIAIETKFTEAPPIDWKGRDYLACQHQHTMLDTVLRTVGCRDCGEERLDLFEVLFHLATTWSRWHREAEALRKLNLEYTGNERDKWERARDRHMSARPDHSGTLQLGRKGWSWTNAETTQPCRVCFRLERDYDPRWYPAKAEPPPGKLTPA